MGLKLYEGKEGIFRTLKDFSKEKKKREKIYSFGYEGGFDRTFGREWWKKFRSLDIAKTKFKGVFSLHKFARKSSSKRSHVKYVKAGKGNIEVAIYQDTVRIYVLRKKKPYVILIQDKAVAKGFKNYWKLLWTVGKEAKR